MSFCGFTLQITAVAPAFRVMGDRHCSSTKCMSLILNVDGKHLDETCAQRAWMRGGMSLALSLGLDASIQGWGSARMKRNSGHLQTDLLDLSDTFLEVLLLWSVVVRVATYLTIHSGELRLNASHAIQPVQRAPAALEAFEGNTRIEFLHYTRTYIHSTSRTTVCIPALNLIGLQASTMSISKFFETSCH